MRVAAWFTLFAILSTGINPTLSRANTADQEPSHSDPWDPNEPTQPLEEEESAKGSKELDDWTVLESSNGYFFWVQNLRWALSDDRQPEGTHPECPHKPPELS